MTPTSQTWPERDRAWADRYRASMAAKHVPVESLDARERELLTAVLAEELPAEHLFGPADSLAAEDATEVVTVEEAVLSAEGGGARKLVGELGAALVAFSVISGVLMVIRGGWSTDLDVAVIAVIGGVAAVGLAWTAGRALFAAGHTRAAIAAVAGAVAVAVVCVAYAANLGGGHLLAHDVPTLLVTAALMVPGLALLLFGSRMPKPTLREHWTDEEWLSRFRSALRGRLVPAVAARGHVAEIEQALGNGDTSAFSEYGHPLILAREIANSDHGARARRWWLSMLGGSVLPAVLAVLIALSRTWGTLTIPVVVVLALLAMISFAAGWGDRPRAQR